MSELWPDDKFQSACREAATIVCSPPDAWPLKPIDVEQGARELGDEMRRPLSEGGTAERNPTAMELCLGYALRSGGKVPHERFVAKLPAIAEFQVRLRP